MSDGSTGVYEELGVRPVINAQGNRTVIGGSSISRGDCRGQGTRPTSATSRWRSSSRSPGSTSPNLSAPRPAYVTSGCCAALALSACACLAGNDAEKMAQLPDTSGMANEIIVLQANATHMTAATQSAGPGSSRSATIRAAPPTRSRPPSVPRRPRSHS